MFIKSHEARFGIHRRAILLLDNCTAHKLPPETLASFPKWLKIVFLPPNVTNKSQPADMGMIASLKIGYKTKMLLQLLKIFDEAGGLTKQLLNKERPLKEDAVDWLLEEKQPC